MYSVITEAGSECHQVLGIGFVQGYDGHIGVLVHKAVTIAYSQGEIASYIARDQVGLPFVMIHRSLEALQDLRFGA